MKSRIRQRNVYFFIVLLVLILSRSFVFDFFIDYYPEKNILIQDLDNEIIKKEISQLVKNYYNDIANLNLQIIEYVTRKLSYSSEQNNKDINKFTQWSKAHCVGYTALHSSVLIYALEKLEIRKKFKVTHQRGTIKFLGFNLNKIIGTAFFKSHDFVKIENLESGFSFYSDASLYEFTLIEKISVK